MKALSSNELSNLSKVACAFTLILTICALILKLLGVHQKFNIFSFCIIGFLFLISLFSKKDGSESSTFLLATLLVGDSSYLISLFFLLGRDFVSKL